MKKNLYYSTVLTRRNVIGEAILNFILGICSIPRLILEVFLRKNMGQRYFTLASAMTVFLILFFIPWTIPAYSFMPAWDIIKENKLWYLFVLAFSYFSFLRYKEVRRNPSVFDFGRYSKSDGDLLPLFKKTKFNIRQTEIFIEPLPVLILGLLLLFLQQYLLGLLFSVCAIIYSLSKAAQYRNGDHFIMDTIDELLCNEDLRNDFLHQGAEQSEHGFKFRHHIPTDDDKRENLYNSFFGEDDNEAAPEAY